jgi:hypothetical protein
LKKAEAHKGRIATVDETFEVGRGPYSDFEPMMMIEAYYLLYNHNFLFLIAQIRTKEILHCSKRTYFKI